MTALEPIFTKDEIETYVVDGYELNTVEFKITETNTFVKRAFNELKENNIISNYNYTEETIMYTANGCDNLAKSKYAIFGDIAYLSWIWIAENFRGKGYGDKLVKQTIQRLKSKNVSKIYTIPKSDSAKYIFENKNKFKSSPEISGYIYKKL